MKANKTRKVHTQEFKAEALKLAERIGVAAYYGSESTFYRVLKLHGQLHHRGRSAAPKGHKAPETFEATGPGQVFCWDITYLPSAVRGQFYYWYMLEDLFSHKIVGDEVHEQESGELAAELLQRTLLRENCLHTGLVLHSDNGAPMKSQTMRAKAYELGVTTSYSRPRVSNDNPFAESQFRTCKYRPEWPSSGFKSLDEARQWVLKFTRWYNYEHKHSQLNFVTPHQRHTGQDKAILAQRKRCMEAAKAANPSRWGKRDVRNCEPVGPTTLNPEKKPVKQEEKQAA